MERRAAKLKWRCRRGMRELDAVLQAFLRHSFAELSDDDKSRFESILDLPDPELASYVLGRAHPSDPRVSELIARIRTSLHAQD